MTTVVWSVLDDKLSWMPLAFLEPEPVYPEIAGSRNFSKATTNNYLTCPAVTGYFKNTFVIKSPVDLDLSFDPNTNWISLKNHNQNFYDSFIKNRCDIRLDKEAPMIMSFFMYYIFYADKPCLIEQLSPSMHLQTCVQNIRVIPGTFDISQWFRPLEATFEIVDPTKPLIIKRGDPLFYARFITKDDSKVTLDYKKFTPEMRNEFNKCVDLKNGIPNLPLKKLYELAKRIDRKIFRKD